MAGSIIGGIFGNKAADAQADAAKDAARTQMDMFERSLEISEPFRSQGVNALSALSYELGLGEIPTFGATTQYRVGDRTFDSREEAERYQRSLGGGGMGMGGLVPVAGADREGNPLGLLTYGDERGRPLRGGMAGAGGAGTSGMAGGGQGIEEVSDGGFQYTGFRETPGYGFLLDEGQKAIDRSLAARGKLLSGQAVKEGMRFSQGLADQTYGNHLARLAQVAGLGSGVALQQGAFANQAGQGIAASQMDRGAARASGYGAIGQGISGAVNFLGGLAGRSNLFGGGFSNPIGGLTGGPWTY